MEPVGLAPLQRDPCSYGCTCSHICKDQCQENISEAVWYEIFAMAATAVFPINMHTEIVTELIEEATING